MWISMATDAGVNSGGMVTVSHSHAHRAVFEDKINVFAYGLSMRWIPTFAARYML